MDLIVVSNPNVKVINSTFLKNRPIGTMLSLFVFLFFVLNVAPAMGQTPQVVNGDFASGIEHWKYQNTGPDGDGDVTTESGALKISRKSSKYFMRASQDVVIADPVPMEINYRMKVQGKGRGLCWISFQTTDNKWLDGSDSQAEIVTAAPSGWQERTVRIPTIPNLARIRISFAVHGDDSTAWVDDVKLKTVEPTSSQSIVVPDLDIIAPQLDGKVDEYFWKYAYESELFKVFGKPEQIAQPNTKVLLATHGDDLWVAYLLDEPNMKGIRDEVQNSGTLAVSRDDCVETFISVNRESMVQFIVNAAAQRVVNCNLAFGPRPKAWHDHPQSKAAGDMLKWKWAVDRREDGWSVEVRIPIGTLTQNSQASKDENGNLLIYANFARHRPQDTQTPYSSWTPLAGKTLHVPEQFNVLPLQWQPPAGHLAEAVPTVPRFTEQYIDPAQLISGKPVIAIWSKDNLTLPGKLSWKTTGVEVADLARQIIEPGLMGIDPAINWTLDCTLGDPTAPVKNQLSDSQQKLLASDEAFSLKLTKDGASIVGRTHAAVMRALATLTLLCDGAKANGRDHIQAGHIIDAPAMKLRGWMMGPTARNSPDDLLEQARILFLLRYNVVMFELMGLGNDTMFPFESHPNIGGSTTTKEQWVRAADTIRALGMMPLPACGMWSRVGYIANKPEYRHLGVRPDLDRGANLAWRPNKNLSSANEEAYELVFDLLDEVIDTLKVDNVHLALDEIFFDDLVADEASKKLGLKDVDWMARVVTRTNEHLKKRGVRMWMWADCLDGDHHGQHFHGDVDKLRARLPKDVVMHDWKYEPIGGYSSIGMFQREGFPTVAAPWWSIENVAGLADVAGAYNSLGYVGTSWTDVAVEKIPAELAMVIPLGAYLSWSPQCANELDQLPVLPTRLYQVAAYEHGKPLSSVQFVPLQSPQNVVYGKALAKALSLPGDILPEELSSGTQGPLGATLQPFTVEGQPAAVFLEGGNTGNDVRIDVRGKAKSLVFLHATTEQPLRDTMPQIDKQYASAIPATYVLEYEDGTTAKLPLAFRKHITSWDDRYPATFSKPVLYGTIGKTYLFNISAYQWENPHPDKNIKALILKSGNRKTINVAVFGVTQIQ